MRALLETEESPGKGVLERVSRKIPYIEAQQRAIRHYSQVKGAGVNADETAKVDANRAKDFILMKTF